NVYLSEGVTLFVDETLDENAQIGVSMKAGCGVFTSGLSGKGGANNFFADEDECSISVHDDGEAYIEKLFNVTFDTDGGSDVDTQTVISGEKAIRPEEDPTKEGYTFTGWYQVTDADAGTLAETEFD
ncbi:InlB B-repeat-containing protein, partial [Vibrio sp. FNV 38]|nr:InlB B-repeat-containing protein [Vibrio sp. FNV 38]